MQTKLLIKQRTCYIANYVLVVRSFKNQIMNLQLSLKKQWFDMTKLGIKTEDYREINYYWLKRLIVDADKFSSLIGEPFKYADKETKDKRALDIVKNEISDKQYIGLVLKKFTTNTMTLGYPKGTDTERIINFEHAGIEIRTGNPDWGAEPNKLYFVIKHGRILE
jgi:hypothetical protein